ncbi:hypothetical protein PG301_00660 [Parageobacillus sp. G301]|nr:hypothetical protein PG301_00660 [Parageobacillus sp. G301]
MNAKNCPAYAGQFFFVQAASINSAGGRKTLPLPLHYVRLKVQAYTERMTMA